ncbi:hypothetical protein RZS08_42110, partial [Arthrospira platensis SPKY1]|nr:hypothetical protein [Arthrospira platensis SPKY1]
EIPAGARQQAQGQGIGLGFERGHRAEVAQGRAEPDRQAGQLELQAQVRGPALAGIAGQETREELGGHARANPSAQRARMGHAGQQVVILQRPDFLAVFIDLHEIVGAGVEDL